MQDTTIQKIRNMPLASAFAAVAGGLTLAGQDLGGLEIMTAVASPILSPALAAPAVLNAISKTRSTVSRAFSAAAAGVGIGVPVFCLGINGPEALAIFGLTTFSMTAAGALNVVSAATKGPKKDLAP